MMICQCCGVEITDNDGLYWAKATGFTDGVFASGIDLTSVFFVCRKDAPHYPPRGSIRYPWVWGPIEPIPPKSPLRNLPKYLAKNIQDMGCLVYILRAGSSYKIGTTGDLRKRIKSLQTGCPERIDAVLSINVPNPRAVELETHEKFKAYRKHGEWFSFDSKTLGKCIKFIKTKAGSIDYEFP